jgi:hypothetical protein
MDATTLVHLFVGGWTGLAGLAAVRFVWRRLK